MSASFIFWEIVIQKIKSSTKLFKVHFILRFLGEEIKKDKVPRAFEYIRHKIK